MLRRCSPLLTLLLATWLLAACGRATTVVLVKNPDGQVGDVILQTRSGSQVLTRAGTSLRSTGKGSRPQSAARLPEDNIQYMFAETLLLEPKAPRRYQIHFLPDTTEIEADSISELRLAHVAIRSRKSCNIRLIGHSNGSANRSKNKLIAELQTEYIKHALMARSVDKDCLSLHYYADGDPLIKSSYSRYHALNQRVEIEVR